MALAVLATGWLGLASTSALAENAAECSAKCKTQACKEQCEVRAQRESMKPRPGECEGRPGKDGVIRFDHCKK